MNGNAFFPLRLQRPDGREYLCSRPVVKIGRNTDCDLSFSGCRALSRYHAEIFFRDGNWYIRDLNSVNGTMVNDRRLPPGEECLLGVGDRIRLATEITLQVLMPPVAWEDAGTSGMDWRNNTIGFEAVTEDRRDACVEDPGLYGSRESSDSTATLAQESRPCPAIMKCPVCGFFYDRMRYSTCPECAKKKEQWNPRTDSTATMSERESAAPAAVFCPVCGTKGSGRFCFNCGRELPIFRRKEESREYPPASPSMAPRPAAPAPSMSPRRESAAQAGVFCPCCGAKGSGMFCNVCGSVLSSPRRSEDSAVCMPTAPSMAPSAAPSMAPRPAAPRPAAPRPAAPRPAPPMAPSMAPSASPSMAPPPAQAAPKKPGLFGKLFGKKQPEPAPARPAAAPQPFQPAYAPPAVPASPQTDDVQFRGAAPRSINPGEYFTVKIMMYREDDYQRADRETAAVADEVKAASSGVYQAARGQEFRITLQSSDVELDVEPEILRWNGIFAAADFEVFLPESFDRKQLRLRGRVYSGDAVLTDLKLILQVSTVGAQEVVCEKVRMRSAFISYASADRAKVVARLQGIMLACPDMDLFFDVESLRRGEAWEPRLYKEISQRDLFYLFWSHNAAASEWVKKELEYAVSQKTVEFIEPIPLEQPDVCPPPESLMCKHFNDWTLRYLNNQ